jgi:hypothetical protein
MLVCDIQGVGDMYTDPQIHSNAGHGNFIYGKGDMGMEGITQFFATHRCNAVCRQLGLTPCPHSEPFGQRKPECGTCCRVGPTPPVPVTPVAPGLPTLTYSPSISPASSVGAISTSSGGFSDFPLVYPAVASPLLPLPMVLA